MGCNIQGIHHLALNCRNVEEFEKTVDFYCDTLGLVLVRGWGEGTERAVMLDTGAGLLEIFASGGNELCIGTVRHLAFDVKNTDAAVESVRKAGYKITVEPTDICIPSSPAYPAKIAFCIGPLGEEIEFFQLK